MLTHPLWSPHHPHLTHLAARLGVAVTALRRCTLFDTLRQPGWYVKQQGMCRQEPGALVAVKERMVLRNPETQCRSEVEKRRIVAIGEQVLRPIHGTIEQGHISDTGQAAEDDNRLIVYGQDHLPGEPL